MWIWKTFSFKVHIEKVFRIILGIAFFKVFSLAWVQPEIKAEDYSRKPITVYTPYPAGGGSDIAFRRLAEIAKEVLGQPIIIIPEF